VVAWAALAADEPALADLAESAFAARRMKTLATLRRDGMPRLSEISGAFIRNGELWLGLIPSAKERDLDRDQRCAVHCGSPTDEWAASARVSGRASRAGAEDVARLGLVADGERPGFALFRIDIGELVVTRPDPDSGQILIEWWNHASGPGRAVRPPG
jgi:hypothetical protein